MSNPYAGMTQDELEAAFTAEDPRYPARKAAAEAMHAAQSEYLDGYALDDGEVYHQPTEFEAFLIHDAANGLLNDEEFVRAWDAWRALGGQPISPTPATSGTPAQPAGVSEPVEQPAHWRAVLDADQQAIQLKPALHVVGFREKRAADAWVAEQRDFNGWRYTLEPLYTHPVKPGGDAPDPMNYKGMFTAAVSSLAEISAALGIEDEDAACANGNEVILEAIARKNEAIMAAVTRPAVGGDAVLVPRDLLGAACSAIDKKRDAPQTLAELRRYTTGDLSGVIGERAHGIGGQGGRWG